MMKEDGAYPGDFLKFFTFPSVEWKKVFLHLPWEEGELDRSEEKGGKG